MNHIAPGRITLRQPDKSTAKEYLSVKNKNEPTAIRKVKRWNQHKHGPSNPMIEHRRQRCLHKERGTGVHIGFRE